MNNSNAKIEQLKMESMNSSFFISGRSVDNNLMCSEFSLKNCFGITFFVATNAD